MSKDIISIDRKKKRTYLVFIWLIFSVAVGISIYMMEQGFYTRQYKKELLEQSDIVAKQIPALAENDFYSQAGYLKLQFDKLKSLSFALESYDNVDEARPLLDDFVKSADVQALMLIDREGKKLYSSDEAYYSDVTVDAAAFKDLYERHVFENTDKTLKYSDEYLEYFFKFDDSDFKDIPLGWFISDRWLLVMNGTKSKARYDIESYFNWANVLEHIEIGTTGCVLAVDTSEETGGTILSFGGRQMQGRKLEELNLRLPGGSQAMGLESLLTEFSDKSRIVQLMIDGVDYYANRIDVDNVLMLALLPLNDINDSAGNASILMAMLMALVSGLAMVYFFLHIGENDELIDMGNRLKAKKRAGRLRISIVLVLVLLTALSLYLRSLTIYADTFSYCQNKLGNVVDLLEANAESLETLDTLSDGEYLSRCSAVKSILENSGDRTVDRSFLNSLCEALSLRYIYIFNEYGTVTVTNSPYDRWKIDNNSPYYDLFRGQPQMIGEVEEDETSGDYRQMIGLSLRDENQRSSGVLLIDLDPVERRTITYNLSIKSLFEQICLKDDTFVLAVNSGDMVIEYMAVIKDGQYSTEDVSFDYTNMSVTSLGIDEERLRDNYNGDLLVLNSSYFASVRRCDDYFIMVMRPHVNFGDGHIYPLILIIISTLVMLLCMLRIACCYRKPGPKEMAAFDSPEEDTGAEQKKKEPTLLDSLREDRDNLFHSFESKRNAFFEERWPEDGIKWTDKTIGKKFSLILKLVVILAFFAIAFHAVLGGKQAIWYYCFNGEWDSGLNLYSITNCIISISILSIIKVIGHRLLYITANVVNSKGETICHLLDSTLGYVLFIIGIFICLSNVGVSTSTLSLTGGVAGVVFGIGCQNIVADILAGIIMVFEGVISAGEFVSYNGSFGSVLGVGIRTTRLKFYGQVTIVRNNDLKNYIRMEGEKQARVIVDLCIDLRENLSRVEEIVERELPYIHEKVRDFSWDPNLEGPEYRGVKEITPNGYVLNFAILVKNMDYGWAWRGMNRELKFMCERNNIRLAMPQIVVNEPLPDKPPESPEL